MHISQPAITSIFRLPTVSCVLQTEQSEESADFMNIYVNALLKSALGLRTSLRLVHSCLVTIAKCVVFAYRPYI